MNNTMLSSSYSVDSYRQLKKAEKTSDIAALIRERFHERYILPFKSNQTKHGFSMMAISCLMLESLYSFRHGLKDTRGLTDSNGANLTGGDVFEQFFRESQNSLRTFNDNGRDFYRCIRNGLFHQAETYGGWRIRRDGILFDRVNKAINATKFFEAMEGELDIYIDNLTCSPISSEIWTNTLRKLDYVCGNCEQQ